MQWLAVYILVDQRHQTKKQTICWGLAVAALFAVTTGKKSLSLATKQGMFGYTANNNVRAKSNAFEFGRNKLGIDADIACS